MATDTTDKSADGQHPARHRWVWFAGLYIASILAVAGVVYGLKFLIAWIVGV